MDGNSPYVMQRLFDLWVHGAFVTDNGGVRGISIGVIRSEATDHPTGGASLRGEAMQETRATTQRDAMAARDDIEAELAGRPLPAASLPAGGRPMRSKRISPIRCASSVIPAKRSARAPPKNSPPTCWEAPHPCR